LEEQDIVLRCQEGESELLGDLVRRHEDSLYRFCYHLCGNADSAAELFQDTWVKALKNIDKYRVKGSILGWLFTIAANLRRDQYRRLKRWQGVMIKSGQENIPDPIADQLAAREEEMLVREALEPMDDSLRIPIILFYFEDYSLETIAGLMGIPVGTVKSRLHRAKKHLRKQLEVLL